MRVLQVDPSAYTPPYDHALCSALAAAGCDVELVTSRFAYAPTPEPDGYRRSERFYRIASRIFAGRPQSRLRQFAKVLEHGPEMAALALDANRSAVDVVHFQWLPVQPLDARLLRAFRKPLVITAHDVLPREPRPGQLRGQERLYRAADAVIVHSRHGRDRLVSQLAIDPAMVHVVPHGAFTHLARAPRRTIDPSLGDSGERPVVLFFGLIRPYKGADVLIEAMARVGGDAELWIVGMPRMPLDPLKALAAERGLADRVRFLARFVGDDELPAYFARADVVALPYREIDQSGVLFTALAFGKPIVATRVGGFAEMADEGAIVGVPPSDPDALGSALDRLLADPAARGQAAERAREAAAGRYSWSAVADRTLAVYGALTGKAAGDPQ